MTPTEEKIYQDELKQRELAIRFGKVGVNASKAGESLRIAFIQLNSKYECKSTVEFGATKEQGKYITSVMQK